MVSNTHFEPIRKRAFYQVGAIIVLVALISFPIISCDPVESPSPTPTPTPTTLPKPTPTPTPTPAPTPTPEPTNGWEADGDISDDEYAMMQTYDNLEIHWSNDDEHLYMAVRAKTRGWVSIGFKPEMMHRGADMVLGIVSGGEAQVWDQISFSIHGPHPPDEQRGGTDDLLEYGGKEDGEYTTIEFKRKLKTEDTLDNELTQGTNEIIWAYGLTDDPKSRHAQRGYGELIIQ